MIAQAESMLGAYLIRSGRFEEAIATLQTARSRFASLAKRSPSNVEYQRKIGAAVSDQGQALEDGGRFSQALERYREAVVAQRKALTQDPRSRIGLLYLNTHYFGVGRCLRRLGRAADSVQAARERAELWPREGGELYNAACEVALSIPMSASRSEADEYAQEAVGFLNRAVAAGWIDPAHTDGDPDLIPLHGRADFRAVIAAMWRKLDAAMPADPFVK
jgi:tetratricopeptide (TPR) repeat protein